MIIETNTNYAYKLKYMDNPSFDKVRDLSTRFYRELPQALQDELFEALNRGIDILDSEPQMTAYLYAFGMMHQAKLQYAFGKLPDEFLSQTEIEIIDYGCGQALGTMCYADFLRTNGYSQKVTSITLIEPSEICLKRAALHASVFFPDAEIKTVNKTFDDLLEDDIVCREETPTLHILSNVLDMTCFNLDKFSCLIKDSLKGYNQFVCVGPYFKNDQRDDQIQAFASYFCDDAFYELKDKQELNPEKDWTCAVCLFFVSATGNLSTKVTQEDLIMALDVDYGVKYSADGKRLLKCPNYKENIFIRKGTIIICDNAFRGCNKLKKIHIPNSVNKIGHHAFQFCRCLTNIHIPNSVISIGEGAFAGCDVLTELFFPDSITIIEKQLFCYLPENVYDLGWKDYSNYCGCKSLSKIYIPNSVTTIKEGAFANCKVLTEIVIPDTIKSIGERAFCGCKSLSELHIPNSIIKLPIGLFQYCESLTKINIPDSVTRIEPVAFADCKKLSDIQIPDSVVSIGFCAFSGCCSLTEIHIPNAITSIEDNVFSDCNSMSKIHIHAPITAIGEYAFAGCSSLIEINIPNTVTSIGESAFFECNSLTKIHIPDSVTFIDDYAFQFCEFLTEINIPDSVISIGEDVFEGCDALSEIIIPQSLKSMGNNDFSTCSNLKKLQIPSCLKTINCFGYNLITVGNSTEVICDTYVVLRHKRIADTQSAQVWFSKCEKAIVEETKYDWGTGRSICFHLKGGGIHSEILCGRSTLKDGDEVDLQSIEYLHIHRTGEDMLRVDGLKRTN